MLWLNENGMPLAMPTWKSMFAEANLRCTGVGVARPKPQSRSSRRDH